MRDPIESTASARIPDGRSHFLEAIVRHAHQSPEKPAVGEIGAHGEAVRECTYKQLAMHAAELAHKLEGTTQVGDAVIATLPSGMHSVACFIAAIAAGVKLLPMPTQTTAAEIEKAAQVTGAKLVIAASGMPAAAAGVGLQYWQPSEIERRGDPRPLTVLRSRAGAIVLSSSGTTGLPKLALRESNALDADAANVIHGMSLSADDCVLVCTPLSHSYGVDLLLATLTAGAALHVVERFDVSHLAAQMERQATVLPGVPFVFEALARVASSRQSRVRLALSAGTSLTNRVRQDFARVWGLEIGQLYGATEFGTVSMEIPGTDGFDPASVGRPLPGVSMRIVDCDVPCRQLSAGIEGHLAVSAPSMLSCYLEGAVPLADGHFLTGDLARIDDTGRVYITGRRKLLIDVGAYKVNPLEIEAEMLRHGGVAECVVVPLAFSDTIQRLRAVYVPSHSENAPSPEELRSFLRARLSPHKVPRVIESAPSLPKGPTGKVLRDKV